MGMILIPTVGEAKKVLPKKITVEKKAVTLEVGDTYTIDYQVKPKKTTNKKVTFKSSKKKIASVTKKGKVTAKKEGTATITIRSKTKKSVKKKVKITVIEKSEESKAGKEVNSGSESASVSVNSSNATLKPTSLIILPQIEVEPGLKYQMTANVLPAGVDWKVTWKCDFVGGINVYPNGSIYITEDTPVGTTATITATCQRLTATCQLTVVHGSCVHEWDDGEITTEATCMEDGELTYTCNLCSKKKAEVISATGHEWSTEGTIKKNPTCIEKGVLEISCSKCQEVKEEEIAVVGHKWDGGTVLAQPTCTIQGKKRYECTVCGGKKTEAIAATGHSWDEGTVTKQPTCTSTGTTTHVCQVIGCGAERKVTIPANGHVYNYGTITKEPTCTATGDRTSECLVCGSKVVSKIAKLGHDMDEGVVTKEPTCTLKGKKTYTCNRCLATSEENIAALKHDWGDYVIDREPTCEEKGKKSKYCNRCNIQDMYSITSISATGHTLDKGEYVEATIEAQGAVTVTHGAAIIKFADDGNMAFLDFSAYLTANAIDLREYNSVTVNVRIVDADGNIVSTEEDAGYGKVALVAGEDLNGYTKGIESWFKTSVESWEKSVTVLLEDADESEIAALAGFNLELCKLPEGAHIEVTGIELSNDDGSIAIPLDGDGVVGKVNLCDGGMIKSPTCTTDGRRTFTCLDCKSYTKTERINAIGHDWQTEYTVDVEPTCVNRGSQTIHCNRCERTKNQKDILSLGHSYDAGTVYVVATCEEDGLMHYECQRSGCIHAKEELIPANGHTYTNDVVIDVPATCAAPGSQSRHCVACGKKTDITLIEPLGHTWQPWSTVQTATCTVPGLQERFCSVCSKVENVAQLPLGHTRNTAGTCGTCGDVKSYESTTANEWQYSLDETNKIITLRYYKGTKTAIKIPATLDITEDGVTTTYRVTLKECEGREATGIFTSNVKRCDVTAVAFDPACEITDLSYVFYNCKELTEVQGIPSTVTNLTATFKGCEKLVAITGALPSNITALQNTFEECSSLTSIPEIPESVTDLYGTFKNATGLTIAPTLPAKVENLNWTFHGCSSLLQAPTLPETVTSMTNTFCECTSLQSVPDLPPAVTELIMTFYGCTTLEKVPRLPETIISMEYTFKNCTGLTYVEPLPLTVENQVEVFEGCTSLTTEGE